MNVSRGLWFDRSDGISVTSAPSGLEVSADGSLS